MIQTNKIKKLFNNLLSHCCVLCNAITHQSFSLCKTCQHNLPILTHSCTQCANFIPNAAKNDIICGQCLQTPPPFNRTYSLFLYQPPITRLILDLKFTQSLIHAQLLGHLLAERIGSFWYQTNPLPSVILPIPLHPQRMKERGFNQALEIARPIAKQHNLPLAAQSSLRIKATQAQATLSADERQKNIQNAFLITQDFSGQHVAVVDDVITTGSTIAEFCRALRNKGATQIDVWCCARA